MVENRPFVTTDFFRCTSRTMLPENLVFAARENANQSANALCVEESSCFRIIIPRTVFDSMIYPDISYQINASINYSLENLLRDVPDQENGIPDR